MRTHGETYTTEYRIWCHMKGRCLNPGDKSYRHYGGRGITICDRWINDFPAFLADMGKRPLGTSLDRINNEGNYEPGNCRWAAQREQVRNSRRTVLVTINGETKPLKDWAAQRGVNYSTVKRRIALGWTAADAVSIPSGPTGVRHPERGRR